MSSSIAAISLSGMNAAQSALGVSAHNIANLGTANFRRQQLELAAVPSGGVTTDVRQAADPGESPTADMIDLLQAKNAFLANLSVFRTSDRMTGSLLDITG